MNSYQEFSARVKKSTCYFATSLPFESFPVTMQGILVNKLQKEHLFSAFLVQFLDQLIQIVPMSQIILAPKSHLQ